METEQQEKEESLEQMEEFKADPPQLVETKRSNLTNYRHVKVQNQTLWRTYRIISAKGFDSAEVIRTKRCCQNPD